MPPSEELLREFLTHFPTTLSALFDDLVKMGRSVEGGVVIPPRLYLRVALVVRSIASLFLTL